MDDVVQLLGGDAGDDVRDERVEDLGGEPAGARACRQSASGPCSLIAPWRPIDAGVAVDGDVFDVI